MPASKPSPAAVRRADVSLARKHVKDAIARLATLMAGDDARISLAAASALLDRAFGKPISLTDASEGETGQTFSIVKRVIIDRIADQDG